MCWFWTLLPENDAHHCFHISLAESSHVARPGHQWEWGNIILSQEKQQILGNDGGLPQEVTVIIKAKMKLAVEVVKITSIWDRAGWVDLLLEQMWSMKERRGIWSEHLGEWWYHLLSWRKLKGVGLSGKIRNSILDILGLRFLIRDILGLKIRIWESLALRLPLNPWDWMRSNTGNRKAGTELRACQHTKGNQAKDRGKNQTGRRDTRHVGWPRSQGDMYFMKRRLDGVSCCWDTEYDDN